MIREARTKIGRWYGVVLALVAVLATWNSLAGYLALPGPKLVSETIKEVIIDDQLLAFYDLRLESDMGHVRASSLRPSDATCLESARLVLVDSAAGQPLESSKARAPRAAFVYSDANKDYAVGETSFTAQSNTRPPSVDVSFVVENPAGASESVLLDEVSLASVRLSDFSTQDLELSVTLLRTSGLVPAAAPLSVLQLYASEATSTDSVVATTDSGEQQIGFELGPGERVRIEISYDLRGPGVYLLKVSLSGFKSGGTRIEANLPDQTFSWAPLSQSSFKSVQSGFTDECPVAADGQSNESLILFSPEVDTATGKVWLNGNDSRRPTEPFRFSWGDGTVSDGWFPQEHVYVDATRDYRVVVTAFYPDGETDSVSANVVFSTP